MNCIIALLSLFSPLLGDSTTYSESRFNDFYNEFLCEEETAASTVVSIAPCSDANPPAPTPPDPPPPPPPPVDPIPPAPIKNYFPLVISNQTGQPDADVYVLLVCGAALQNILYRQSSHGLMALKAVDSTTYTPTYSYKLTDFPVSTTGSATGWHNYIIYTPETMGKARIYFSVGRPLNFLVMPGAYGSQIQPAVGNAFNDPNFNILYDFSELTMTHNTTPGTLPYTPTIDTSSVDFLGLSTYLALYSYDSNHPEAVTLYEAVGAPATNPAGFSITRTALFTDMITGLTPSNTWGQLPIPFYTNPYTPAATTTYLRILSPKQSVSVTQPQGQYTIPQFPLAFLTTATAFNYVNAIFSHYSGATKLYITADRDGSGETYEIVSSDDTMTFTGMTNPSYTATLTKANVTVVGMYSGTPNIINGGSMPAIDLIDLKKYFGTAFVVGLLTSEQYESSSAPLNDGNLKSHLPRVSGSTSPIYFTNPFVEEDPSYNLYSYLMHQQAVTPTSPPYPSSPPLPTLGLCYAYDYDDVLDFSSTVSEPASASPALHVYAMLTFNAISSVPTGVFDDPTTYSIKFIFTTGPLQYRQGSSGNWTSLSNNETINNIVSTATNPFQIQYQGLIFNVFPKYQFVYPVDQYSHNHDTVVKASGLFVPTNTPENPTAFELHLPGL